MKIFLNGKELEERDNIEEIHIDYKFIIDHPDVRPIGEPIIEFVWKPMKLSLCVQIDAKDYTLMLKQKERECDASISER